MFICVNCKEEIDGNFVRMLTNHIICYDCLEQLYKSSRIWAGNMRHPWHREENGNKPLNNRGSYAYKAWRIRVLQRDNDTCQKCGSKENLKVHHIKSYAEHEDLRTEVSNGITLCGDCHDKEH